MDIRQLIDTHNATAKTLDEHYIVSECYFIGEYGVVGDFLFNPTLEA
jgi:hypothetical protein